MLRRYLNDLAAETNRLPWGRLSPEQAGPDQGEVLRLADVYTALDTTEPKQIECEDDLRKCLARLDHMERIPVQQMINDHDRLVLLGDPGSGKTTVVNFLAHTMARAGVNEDSQACLSRLLKAGPWVHGPLLPIRIVLREVGAWMTSGEGGQHTIGAWIRKTLIDAGLESLWPVFHEGLQDPSTPYLILLDGLDEVPADLREQLVRLIDDFSDTYQHNRFLVTCRIYAYVDPAYRLRRFRQTILAPFDDDQIDQFIQAWYDELAFQKRVSQTKADDLAKGLKTAIDRSDLKTLAGRPLIMTVMALLHTSYGQLPEDRVELYQWAVDLLFRRWKGHVGQGESGLMAQLSMPQLKMSDLMAGLYHVAFQAHAGQGSVEGTADIAEEVLLKQLKPFLGDDWNRAEAFVQYVRERAGLLIRHKTDAYTFPHRTFQEFMAACHLTGLKDYPHEAARLVRENADLWRIVFVLAAGHAGRTQLGNAISAVGKLCLRSVSEVESIDAAAFTRAVIAGEALLEIGLAAVRREEEGRILMDRVKEWLVAAMTADDVLAARQRVYFGNFLVQLGDPRFDFEKEFLPYDRDLGFIEIPAGSFVMGEDKKRHEVVSSSYAIVMGKDKKRYEVVLSSYAMAKYPVTVAQYKAFAIDIGQQLSESWSRFNRLDNHPVVFVSWVDANTYCRWLTEKLEHRGLRVTLPTEAQWERAARGLDALSYYWGYVEIDPEKANYNKTGISSTSPVGCFPKGKSEFGLFDLAGNVWEWCQDWYGDYPLSREDKVRDPIGPSMGEYRVIRGGAWNSPDIYCQSVHREYGDPGAKYRHVGFRLVCLPGQHGEPGK
ncbi:SUMF1/EgtB/PvdO family nonheme iron enzyme [Desulfosarcina ovata]|uniref:NACHT domain-containing protein n=1 Tax=Desulfosarcina ovata subsp. ovata TaxID=2752305 RepID=A0A5K8AF26_9BACT|nr:SUMF1/EgtB/PvdO family nonheme iron enzyme [Desulfosarcina ovata]BBO91149.1 hypothetical protein DSCOOX_43290 [Desulfosarcina ovata subsp. ovata]